MKIKEAYNNIAGYKPRETFKHGNTITDGNFMIKLEVAQELYKQPTWMKDALLSKDRAPESTDTWLEIAGNKELIEADKALLSTRVEVQSDRILGMLMTDKKYSIIKYGFFKFFKDMFPYCEFYVSDFEKPIRVKSGNQEIGLFMPIGLKNKDYSWMCDDPSVKFDEPVKVAK